MLVGSEGARFFSIRGCCSCTTRGKKILAGMNPNCDVSTAITQIRALFRPAISQSSHRFLPIRMVEPTVRMEEI